MVARESLLLFTLHSIGTLGDGNDTVGGVDGGTGRDAPRSPDIVLVGFTYDRVSMFPLLLDFFGIASFV